ncbi:DUF748 domain-containing protein [Pseudomonas songnenensis]|uniref:DUF748 domain-containing protein n=1 Tax=Pseudomonas songnenensis TaxID=1176259 RepID=A0ABX9V2B6_9PSED|nr:DUF748 domain-containing protein [Pseudomonas songnenensis]MCQ4301535.1 DUF748 domain-containing protein [Pseudomonas songnenensis]RMH99860.1 DUF748 domain-containing protein [Pseudomonas songnenensis]
MPNGMKRAFTGVALVLICYSLLGFLILPGIAQRVANQQLANYATVPANLQRIEFNPFSLELSLFGLRIGAQDDRQLAFERLYLDLQWDSLWQRTLHLAAVELWAPHVEARFARDGALNLGQLFEVPEAEATTSEAGEIFPLRIDRLQLVRGHLGFEDKRPSEPIVLIYDSLDFELHNLATRSDGSADARLTASGPSGGRIDWQGDLSLQPLASRGSLQVSKLQLKDFWPYVRDAAPLVLKNGTLELSTGYRLDLDDGFTLTLENASAAVGQLALDSPDGRKLVRLERLELSDTALDLAKQQVTIGTLRSRNLETWAAREADGELDWQKLFASSPAKADASKATAEEQAQPAAEPWQLLLRDAQLRDYRVHLADRVPDEDVELALGPLNLDIRDFDSLGNSPFALKLDTGVGKQGAVQASGQLQLSPMSGRLAVTTRDIDLRIAQAYLSPLVHLELRSGMLASELDIDLQGTEPLAFSVRGSADATQLHTLDTINNRDFVKWQRLQLSGLDYRHPNSLAIDRIDLSQPYARFIINPDLSTNINDLLVKRGDPPSAAEEQSTPASEPLAIRIGGIGIANGSANFADFSLRPPFVTAIQSLNGEIGTLDNREQKAASVNIAGKVDQYAPVSIKGKLTPFDPLQSLDIATSFRQVELTTLTPYSGKFAGYRIRKGRLNLDLHYRIEQGRLNAENKVVLEQLQLGEKVDSPDAVDLPVRLAVALLKDSNGTISIELPVQGNLNDPQFSVMPIVWQTLRNLVVRAAQAPFKFIAGLAGGDDSDLSHIGFEPASSTLDAEARKVLDTLAAALKQRPGLRLEVEGMSAGAIDGPLLAEQRLQQEYRETQYRILQRRGDKVPADPSLIRIETEDEAPLLEGIYRSRLGHQPPSAWAELDAEQRTQQMRQAVLESWADNATLLRRLSRDRAAAIKGYLVEAGLDSERVYLLDTGTAEQPSDGKVATALHLGSD